MKAIIKAKVPTAYQSSSLHKFNMPVTKHADGSLTAEMIFDNHEKAVIWLKHRAIYYNDYEGETAKHLLDLFWQIEQNYLTIDAATAYIEDYPEQEDYAI
jgi:hypothetical protein